MRKSIFLIVLLFIARLGVGQPADVIRSYAETISVEDLKESLTILSSDALEGRETGTRGQKMAAAFIAHHFEELGLHPPVNNSFYQPIVLYSALPGETFVKSGNVRFDNFQDVVYYGSADMNSELAIDAVFVGKGSEADYTGLTVKDRAVVIYTESKTFENSLKKVVDIAQGKGAKLVMIVSEASPDDFKQFAEQMQSFLSVGTLSRKKPDSGNEDHGLFFINQLVAEKVFNTPFLNLTKAAKESSKTKALVKIKPARLSYQSSLSVKQVKTENVLGYLEGTDKKDEVIVITAHYDHIGVNSSGSGDRINNGADDDGSGTVAVLEMAQAFVQAKKEGHGPRRSILFMTVTGEEGGLMGSEFYVENPVFPLANTVANLNIDMIGRRDPEHAGKPDYVYVIGSDKLSTELHEINIRNNQAYTQLEFDFTYNDEDHPTNLYRRSDHWNFAKNGIPITFYFDGIHEDYHRVTDEVEKIEFDLLAKRAQSLFYTAWELANREERIKVDKESKR